MRAVEGIDALGGGDGVAVGVAVGVAAGVAPGCSDEDVQLALPLPLPLGLPLPLPLPPEGALFLPLLALRLPILRTGAGRSR